MTQTTTTTHSTTRSITAEVLRGMLVGFEINGEVYVRVNLAERYPEPGAYTLAEIGRDLVVHPQKLLRALLSERRRLRAVNAGACDHLFLEYSELPELSEARRPRFTASQKRDRLRYVAVEKTIVSQPGGGLRSEPSYYRWALPRDVIIAVPLSRGMVDVIEQGRRWDAVAPDVAAFETQLYRLADEVIALRKALTDLCTVGQRGLHEVGMLVGLSQYCDLLLDQQGNPEPGESPLADFQEFLQRSAIPQFNEQIVCNPVDLAPRTAAARDRHARKIMEILDHPDFKAGMKLVVENHDLVPHRLVDDAYYYLTAAADLLSVTDQAEKFAEQHALPMMRGIAELPGEEFEETVAKYANPGLQAALVDGWRDVLPERDTVFKLALGIGTAVIGSVSNLEGPRSFGVAVMMQYQIHLFTKGVKDYRNNVAGLNRAIAMFNKHFGDVDIEPYCKFYDNALKDALQGKKVDLGRAAKEAKLHVTHGPFRSRSTRATMALLAVSIFGIVLASDPDGSPTSALSVATTFGTMGVATLDWTPIASALEKRWGQGFTAAVGGFAGFVGFAGLVTSTLSLIDAIEKGDDLSIVEGALSTIGSTMSFAGWALASKFGALAFAPSLMMTVGSGLILAGLGIAIWRTLSPREPIDIVQGSLEIFQEPDSRASITGLQPTVETLIAMADETLFPPLRPTYRDALRALGYDPVTVDVLTGQS